MEKIRNTRIICTMGPAVDSVDKIRALIRAGMNIARFNFSHGDHKDKAESIAMVRKAAELEKATIALLADTKGPEIRTGLVKGGGNIVLESGETVDVMASEDGEKLYGADGALTLKEGGRTRVTVSYELLADDIRDGARILIADGLLSLEFISLEGRVMRCRVEAGGELGSRKNVNVLGVHTRLPAMSAQDMADLRFAAGEGMDCVAASFIRKRQDVTTIQKFLASIGSDMPVIAKIEDEEGLDNISDIIRVSAGVMVARGDLGVQIPPEQVPLAQKRIIELCNNEGKPVITATQMLDSMIRNPRPTRAEAADVANAILDGSDCVMLSGETANGAYPEEAVETMNRIALTVEASDVYRRYQLERRGRLHRSGDMPQSIAESAVLIAETVKAACIITPTISGNTARLVSKYRPLRPIIGASPSEEIRRRMLLYWGIIPLAVQNELDSEATIQGAQSAAIKEGFIKVSDKVVFTAGMPVNSPYSANTIQIHVIGKILGRGQRGFGGRCTGRIVKANTLDEASYLLRSSGGEILLTHTLDNSFIPIIRIARGIIVEGSSEFPRDMLRMINPNIVYIAQVEKAMANIEEHITVTIDGTEKIVYDGTIE
ncbi:MAG: pyruvate kinase [Spirochaetaceae bacterium]|jgi:pyruvate kinase|nr:pyruvate kinase [Spirochaetaceae bacterium]